MTQQEKLKDLAELIVMRWGAAINNDEPISGCDAVDSLGNYARCSECDWDGTVAEMTIDDEEEAGDNADERETNP